MLEPPKEKSGGPEEYFPRPVPQFPPDSPGGGERIFFFSTRVKKLLSERELGTIR